jgi:hypothetical protein
VVEVNMKNAKYLLCMILLFLSVPAYSQYLAPEDIDIFINGYTQIKSIFDSRDDEGAWAEYDRAKDAFTKTSEEYIRKAANADDFSELQRRYHEISNCRMPGEVEGVYRAIGWETGGNRKFMTISLGFVFLYGVQEMERRGGDIPKWAYKLFVEKYYSRMVSALRIFNEDDIDKVNLRVGDLKDLLITEDET